MWNQLYIDFPTFFDPVTHKYHQVESNKLEAWKCTIVNNCCCTSQVTILKNVASPSIEDFWTNTICSLSHLYRSIGAMRLMPHFKQQQFSSDVMSNVWVRV